MNNLFKTLSLCSFAAVLAIAQDVKVNTNTSQPEVFRATNTGSQSRTAIKGVSRPSSGAGIGVVGDGGAYGVMGIANFTGSLGTRRGGSFFAAGSSGGTNAGLWSEAAGPAQAVGIYAYANSLNGIGAYIEANTAQAGSKAAHFIGDITHTGSITQVSDARFKKNVTAIDAPLSKVMKLKARTFEFKTEEFPKLGLPKGVKYGLIAQEVEAVIPAMVNDNIPLSGPADATASNVNYKSVDYTSLIPVLIGAIQEQQAQIEALKAQLAGKK